MRHALMNLGLKRGLIVFILIGVIAFVTSPFWRSPRWTHWPPKAGQLWVAFGDSLTAGVGASPGRDYPAQLGQDLGWPIHNAGGPGQTTQDALGRVDEIVGLRPGAVLLCFGGNDTLRGVSPEETFANLGAIVDRLHGAGAAVVLIGVRSASVFDKNEGRFKQLAREKNVLYVPDILRGVFGQPRLMADMVHPNDDGYAVIAERLAGAISRYLDRSE